MLNSLFIYFILKQTLTFQVWRVDGNELSLIPVPEQKKLFSSDCYIVQYTYPCNGRDENLFYAWLGRGSVMVSMVYPARYYVFCLLKLKAVGSGFSEL